MVPLIPPLLAVMELCWAYTGTNLGATCRGLCAWGIKRQPNTSTERASRCHSLRPSHRERPTVEHLDTLQMDGSLQNTLSLPSQARLPICITELHDEAIAKTCRLEFLLCIHCRLSQDTEVTQRDKTEIPWAPYHGHLDWDM